MKPLRQIIVKTPGKNYPVVCGKGALRQAAGLLAQLGPATGLYVLSSPRVWRHWGGALKGVLPRIAREQVVLFDDREAAKNLETLNTLCRSLVRAGADRRAVIVALGGGVVGDVAGFVAASYLRGVRLVHIPTTLVAQVDSAIGGKTGVNLPEGKNLVGAFYQPDLVVCDSEMLRTLPDREYRSGFYEVIKYGVIGDAELFGSLERDLDRLLDRDARALSEIIPRCIRQKARVTAADEREAGRREILNFGHTLGHALESVTRYRVYGHGEAVGWGMIAAALVAVATDHLALEQAARIIRLVRRVGSLPDLPRIPAARVIDAMRSDKKTRGGRLRLVLPRRIGRVEWGVEVSEQLLAATWKELASAGSAEAGGTWGSPRSSQR
jgi:3-dehydroquinate synthase